MLKLMSASVGLCTYNAQRHLAQQLDSILLQTHPLAEIVVIDDVSTDGTQDILKDYATRHPGIFRLELNSINQGAKKNFERLLAECQGDAIFLSDHDDIWAPQKVERMLAHFNTHPQDKVLFSNAKLINDAGEELKGCLWTVNRFTAESRSFTGCKEDLFRYLLRHERMVTGATLAISKDFVSQLLPFRMMNRMWHDAWIAFAAASHAALNYVDEQLISYRIHANQQVGCNGAKLERMQSGEDMISPVMRRELQSALTHDDLVALVHTRRKRVKQCRRLGRFLPIDPSIAEELLTEQHHAETAFANQFSFWRRWKETMEVKMFNKWPQAAKAL